MASKRALKVFRTSAGFEDAYIAAPSQKAALEAWGAKRNLFAQGAADLVKDPDLVKAALAHPGKVLRVPRGTTAQHLAAAIEQGGGERPGDTKAREIDNASAPKRKPARSKPRPSRAGLEEAQRQLADRRARLDGDLAELDRQIEAIKTERSRRKIEGAEVIADFQNKVDAQEKAYRKALSAWEG